MTQIQFDRMVLQYPHLTFTKIKERIILREYSYTDEFGIYDFIKKTTYLKSNGRTCYVEKFIKRINVDRNMVTPKNDGYSFMVKPQFLKQIFAENNLTLTANPNEKHNH